MKKLTRKLFISILAAVFAVVALGTSTFAWITISNTAVVEQFSGTVEAGEAGILISSNSTNGTDGTWSAKINLQDKVDLLSVLFSDITSADGKTFKDYKLSQDGAQEIEAPATSYIETSFWVKKSENAGPEALKVYLDNSKITFDSPDSGNYTPDVQVAGFASAQTNIKVSNAARASFEVGGVVKGVFQQQDQKDGNTLGYSAAGFAHAYMDAKNVARPEYAEIAAATAVGSAGTTELVELTDAAVEVTVRVWVEGWDNECHFNILNHILKTGFVLTTEPYQAK